MEKTKNNSQYSYSHDYVLVTAFTQELSSIRIKTDRNNEMVIVEEYLSKRIKEIKDRWK